MPANMCRIYYSFDHFTWTETYYRVGESLTQSLLALNALARARAPILGGGVTITQTRVATDPPTRATRVDGVLPNSSQGPICLVNDAVLVRFQANPLGMGGNYWRSSYFRGIPQAMFPQGYSSPAQWDQGLLAQFQGWLNLLCDGTWYLRVSTKEQPWYSVLLVEDFGLLDSNVLAEPFDPDTLPEDAARLIIGLSGAPNFPLADPITGKPSLVRLRNVSWSQGFWPSGQSPNGLYSVLDTLPGGVVVQGKLPTGPYTTQGGFLRLDQVAYAPIRSAQVESAGTRRTGGRSSYFRVLAPTPVLPEFETLPPPKELPPQKYQVPPPVFAKPVYKTLYDCLDVVQEVWLGYTPAPDGSNQSIGIAEILNHPGYWAVFCSGTQLNFHAATNIPEDVFGWLTIPDQYSIALFVAIETIVPRGAYLVMAGHSLGGIEIYSVTRRLTSAGYSVGWIIAYGAPTTVPALPVTNVTAFQLEGDSVCDLGSVGAIMRLLGYPDQTILFDADIPTDLYHAHLGYPDCQLLRQWDAWGYKKTDQFYYTMVLGFMHRLPAPRG